MHPRRGAAGIAVIVVLVILQIALVGAVLAGARGHDATARHLESLRASYAAEAGVNMAVRELRLDTDFDGDGTIGTISDDGNDANDPALGPAQFTVTLTAVAGGQTTLRSAARCGESRRHIQAILD